MYVAIVLLTMLILPAASLAIEHALRPELALIGLLGRWFVFWGMGVRLSLAGARQLLQPAFTAREIFHMTGDEALVIVQELGVANIAAGVVALVSLFMPTFVVPTAIYGVIFYGVAGVRHIGSRDRSRNETVALASDLFIALVFAVFLAANLGR
ncbi:MAG: hypothetical protein E7774_10625 [Bradyrhizobium sp.]|nr:MAG: hypothetical protein E7774_10625 [Bradyrhizobium sp.]